MRNSKKIAVCGMTIAICMVILLIGGWIGVGTYAAPILAGICIIPVCKGLGARYGWLVWLGAAVLGSIMTTDIEEMLIYIFFFGWYPIVRDDIERIVSGKVLRMLLKLIMFNVATVIAECLFVLVFVPASEAAWMMLVLLLLGNIVFVIYDKALPRVAIMFHKRLGKNLFVSNQEND